MNDDEKKKRVVWKNRTIWGKGKELAKIAGGLAVLVIALDIILYVVILIHDEESL